MDNTGDDGETDIGTFTRDPRRVPWADDKVRASDGELRRVRLTSPGLVFVTRPGAEDPLLVLTLDEWRAWAKGGEVLEVAR